MLVQNKHLTTIWYENESDKIKIIDQRLIPFELKIVELNTVDEICFAIKEMQVRGAPLIGVTAAFGMSIAARENSDFTDTTFGPLNLVGLALTTSGIGTITRTLTAQPTVENEEFHSRFSAIRRD